MNDVTIKAQRNFGATMSAAFSSAMNKHKRIRRYSTVLCGTPVIMGTRITVPRILRLLSSQEFLTDLSDTLYNNQGCFDPSLHKPSRKDFRKSVRDAISFAADVINCEVDTPGEIIETATDDYRRT